MTGDGFDNKDKTPDQHHHWNYRAPFIKTMLSSIHPDVFCLQELSPDMAIELEHYFCKQLGYKAVFLSQTPSEIETGSIAFNDEVSSWKGKWPAAFLIGTFISKDWQFAQEGAGRFWLNENPDEVPQSTDRGTIDKGFGNMNTYRAVLWVKIENDLHKSLFVFHSHYPLDGTSKTRQECAKLEMKKIDEITKGEKWVSTGDRNIIPIQSDDELYNPESVYREFVKHGYDVRDADNHFGVSTTWIGFTYDNYKNQVVDGDFQSNKVLDVMVSNMKPELSFSHPGVIDSGTMQLAGLSNPLDESQNESYYFASDHCLIGGDF